MWNAKILNKRGKSQNSSRRAAAKLYPNAFAGISKDDIVKKSTEEIVLKIKNNLKKSKKNDATIQENPMASHLESKPSQRSRIEAPAYQNYYQIVKKFEEARKSYYTKMDRDSLENYHQRQIVMSKNEMDQSYFQTCNNYIKTLDEQDERSKTNMKTEATNYFKNQTMDDSLRNGW